MKDNYSVFVYGTLRKGEKYADLLKDAACIASQAWVNGCLYETEKGYPALVKSEADICYGEVYTVNADELAMLDVLEGFEKNSETNLFIRKKIDVNTDQETFEAYVYFLADNNKDMLKEQILTGDWKLSEWLKQRPERIFYFAYGSCMDTERIGTDGAAELFNQDVLVGRLAGYSLCYSLESTDGGRADIKEGEGYVEGILYTVTQETIEYLFRREGVNAGRYRPAFVTVEVNGQIFTNVLTFSVINKKKDITPPDHYALEILRGAKGRVSMEYYQLLKLQLNKLGVETHKLEQQLTNNSFRD